MAEAAGSGSGLGIGGPQGAACPAAPATAPPQPRRKISLPWFRQSSFGIGTASKRLPKQHTIGGVTSSVTNDSLSAGSNVATSSNHVCRLLLSLFRAELVIEFAESCLFVFLYHR